MTTLPLKVEARSSLTRQLTPPPSPFCQTSGPSQQLEQALTQQVSHQQQVPLISIQPQKIRNLVIKPSYSSKEISAYLEKQKLSLGHSYYDAGLFQAFLTIELLKKVKGNTYDPHNPDDHRMVSYFLKKQLELAQSLEGKVEYTSQQYEDFASKTENADFFKNLLISRDDGDVFLPDLLKKTFDIFKLRFLDMIDQHSFDPQKANLLLTVRAVLFDLSNDLEAFFANPKAGHQQIIKEYHKYPPLVSFLKYYHEDSGKLSEDSQLSGLYFFLLSPQSTSLRDRDALLSIALPILSKNGALGVTAILYALSKDYSLLAGALETPYPVHNGVYKGYFKTLRHDWLHTGDHRDAGPRFSDFLSSTLPSILQSELSIQEKKGDIIVLFILFFEMTRDFPPFYKRNTNTFREFLTPLKKRARIIDVLPLLNDISPSVPSNFTTPENDEAVFSAAISLLNTLWENLKARPMHQEFYQTLREEIFENF